MLSSSHVISLSLSGPPEGWQGGPPSRGCEVYVTRIPRDCFEQELMPVFSRAGEIYEMRLMMDHNGLNRGYAYVKFTNTQVRSSDLKIVCLLSDTCRMRKIL